MKHHCPHVHLCPAMLRLSCHVLAVVSFNGLLEAARSIYHSVSFLALFNDIAMAVIQSGLELPFLVNIFACSQTKLDFKALTN